MTNIARIRMGWNGIPTGQGISTFYDSDTTTPHLTAIRAFFQACQPFLPSSVVLGLWGDGSIIDSATGAATGVWHASIPPAITGTGSANYEAPVGAVVDWKTGIWVGRRQLVGRTFLVPLVASCFDAVGQVSSATRSTLDTAAATLCSAAPTLRVYSKRYAAIGSVASGSTSPTVAVLGTRKR